jgi:hypothetical protein
MHDVADANRHRQPETERNILLKNLCDFAVKGLVPMFDNDKKLFCHLIRKTEEGVICDGSSLRYTMITLLGLKRYEQCFGSSPISIPMVFNEVLNKSASIGYAGDAGLLLWLTAMVAPERINEVYSMLDIIKSWKNYPDATKGMTTELSWLLTGLCYAMLKGDQHLPGLTDTSTEVFDRIKANYGGKGIFRHQHRKTLTGALRGNIGCFADQVYPIYAFSLFTETHKNSEALTMIEQCGESICELQGNYGQWWWHYDAKTGKTAGRYPVFSVHQYGMAPMALFASTKRTGIDYEAPIYKGLEWIFGKNELGIDMRDSDRNSIWRNFHQKKWRQRRELLLSIAGTFSHEEAPAALEILHECRPYSLGWLLYAFADKVVKKPRNNKT